MTRFTTTLNRGQHFKLREMRKYTQAYRNSELLLDMTQKREALSDIQGQDEPITSTGLEIRLCLESFKVICCLSCSL